MKNLTLLTFCFIALLVFTKCSSGKDETEKEEKVNFTVTSPFVRDTIVTREYVSQIKSINHIELRALEKGYLQKIYVDEGQFVKKGQLMFQIMPMIYQAERQKAQAEVDFVNIEYENTKTLADEKIVSKNELALAKAKLDKAKAELSLADVHLAFTQIRAPFDGIMDHFQVRLGSLVDEGDLLTTLSDNSKMWVYFNVPEAEYLDYQTGITKNNMLKVNLMMANNQLFDQPGVVETIEADFNNETGNIAFRATFPNPKRLLRHGETGNVIAKTTIKNAVMVPQKSTFEILDKTYVYVLDKDNIAHARLVTIGEGIEDLFIVTNGLKAGEKIILDGIRKVKENDKIKFTFVKPEVASSNLKVAAE